MGVVGIVASLLELGKFSANCKTLTRLAATPQGPFASHKRFGCHAATAKSAEPDLSPSFSAAKVRQTGLC
jgi:hypothetical protein